MAKAKKPKKPKINRSNRIKWINIRTKNWEIINKLS